MFRAFGVLILIWGLTQLFAEAFVALEQAAIASFNTIELAATLSQANLQQIAE